MHPGVQMAALGRKSLTEGTSRVQVAQTRSGSALEHWGGLGPSMIIALGEFEGGISF